MSYYYDCVRTGRVAPVDWSTGEYIDRARNQTVVATTTTTTTKLYASDPQPVLFDSAGTRILQMLNSDDYAVQLADLLVLMRHRL